MDSKLEFMVDTLDSDFMDFGIYGGSMLNIGEPYDTDPDGFSAIIMAPFIKDPAFAAYVVNQEERKKKIEKVIQLLAECGPTGCNDFDVQCQIYNDVGIDSDTFTDKEVKYIEEEVARRL